MIFISKKKNSILYKPKYKEKFLSTKLQLKFNRLYGPKAKMVKSSKWTSHTKKKKKLGEKKSFDNCPFTLMI